MLVVVGACVGDQNVMTAPVSGALESDLRLPTASVTVDPASVTATVGDSGTFTAVIRDIKGRIVGGNLKWSSTDTNVVRVRSNGFANAVGVGTADVRATNQGITGVSHVTIVAAEPPPPPPPPPPPAPVASISVSPGSASIDVLGSVQLTATLRDSSGNELTGRSVTWSSSNGLVAVVNSNGGVTGVIAGNATITASSEGVSGASDISVTLLPPPPPPPSSGWSNMPSTYSILSDQAFNPPTLPGWELIWNPVGNGTIADNSTAPFSATSVFQVRYPAGFAAGSAPATQIYWLGTRRNVYVGMWWKANANWQGHDSYVNKLQFLFPHNGGGDMYLTAYGPPGGPYELRTNLQFVGADTRSWLVPNTATGVVSMGEWHKIEWLVEYNSAGSANGVVRWWLDGQLVGNYGDVTFPSTGFDEYKLSPTWGGMGGSKTQTDYFWFDHVVIATR